MTDPNPPTARWKTIPVANPGAGNEISVPMSGIGSWIVQSIAFLFTSSAVVANREVTLVVDDGTTVFARYGAPAVQAASLANNYSGFTGSPGAGASGNYVPLPFQDGGIYLEPGYRLRTITQNLDAGDAYTAIGLRVVELPWGDESSWIPISGFYVRQGE